MPLKKSLIFSLLLVLGGMTGRAQSPRIIYSEPERDDSRRTSFEIIGKMRGNFLVYKSNRSDDAVCIYDNDMNLKNRVKLEFTPDGLINVDFVAFPEFFFMIYEYQKKGVVHCAMAKLDAGAHKMMEPVELDTTQVGWGSGNKIYTTLVSDDKQRIMVFKINSKNQKNFVFTTLLYNSNLELLGKHRMNMPMEERNDFFTDFMLSNDGDLVYAKCLRENYNEYITKLSLVIKYPDSSDFSVNNVETGGRILDEVKIKVDNTNKRILLNAFYYKQKRGNIDGLYSVLWDKVQNRKIREIASVFNEDLRNSAKSSDGSVRMAFDDYFIKNVIIRRDGGYLLISESEYTSSRAGGFNRWDYLGGGNPWLSPMDYSYWSPYGAWNSPWNRWNNTALTRYHADNIMVLSYDSEGGVEWSNVMAKNQWDDESDNEISFQVMNTGEELHFLFNSDSKTKLLSDQSLNAEGKISRNPTLKNLDRGYEFMARYGKQVSSNQMIVPCVYRSYLCMAKIDF